MTRAAAITLCARSLCRQPTTTQTARPKQPTPWRNGKNFTAGRKMRTPLGLFDTCADAAAAHGVDRGNMYRWIKCGVAGFTWEEA